MTQFIGSNLRLIRLYHNLSLSDLGEDVGVSKQFLSRLETGGEAVSDSLLSGLSDRLQVLPDFFGQIDANPITEEQCHFRSQLTTKAALRQSARARGEMLKRLVGVLDAHLDLPSYSVGSYEPDSVEAIERAAESFRDSLGLGRGPLSSLTRIAENAGAVVMRVQGLASEIDAISFATKRPLIALNDCGRSGCRQRFGIAHELGHFALHVGLLTGDRLTETQANRFASALLMPRTTFANECKLATRGSRLNWQGLSTLKLRWGVSKAAIIYRGRQLGILSEDQARAGYIGLKRHGEALQELEDHLVPPDDPEIVSEGLKVMKEHYGIPVSAVAREMRVFPALLGNLLMTEEPMPANNVVRLHARAD
ncbi:helix-turn-helix domain-containing protein [Dyella kyungheensis]|uniref:ImmA/IrrE family metallo-endopeptidase n=1 Tax=Dyella kyungheensis TaxID=1242174 RepID=A0ABS2JMF4_9GAMM|nr:XRE family transcriptional regulator [Dyella kyungheensis]MBM7120221.1 ImmA/IrrE family metallo-endopeptidase [Dyella kyungheensis]